jgi:hypothetical protein
MFNRLLLFSALLLTLLPAFAISQTTYSVPRAVALEPVVRRTFGSFWRRLYPGGPMQGLMTEGFYPIGWSRDGKFAYYFEPVDEECGCYFAELAIVDLRTDKVLWHYKNNWEDRIDKEGAPIPDDIRKLWNRNQKTFDEKLAEHGIVQQGRFALLGTTFTIGGKTYVSRLAKTMGKDSDGNRRVRKLNLELSTPSLGKKSLHEENFGTGDELYGAPLEAAVAGALKSPFENRAAVVMLRVNRGWEGPPHTVDFRIAGADLANGFKK